MIRNTSSLLFFIVLMFGSIPAAWRGDFWRVWITLWGMMGGLWYLRSYPFFQRCLPVMTYSASAYSLWLILQFLLPSHSLITFFIFLLLGFIGYQNFCKHGINLWLNEEKKIPSPLVFTGSIFGCIFIFIGVHIFLDLWRSPTLFMETFSLGYWTSVSLAGLSLVVCYPQSLPAYQSLINARRLGIVIAVMVVMILGRWGVGTYLQGKLAETTAPGKVAQQAFQHGYNKLGIDAVMKETVRVYQEKGWREASAYLRSQWRHVDSRILANAFRETPELQKNLFLFVLTFGGQLHLQEGEAAIDLAISPGYEHLLVLTDQGRILIIGNQGISTLWQSEQEPVALAFSPQNQSMAILMKENFVIVKTSTRDLPILYLQSQGVWRDVVISRNGEKVWVLEAYGRVEFYQFSAENNDWNFEGYVSQPLWQEVDGAQGLLLAKDESGVFLLDQFGGIHWCSSLTIPEPYSIEMMEQYYDPLSPKMVDIGFSPVGETIFLANVFGRIHFIDPTVEGITKVVRATMFFDKFNSHWVYPMEMQSTVAVVGTSHYLQLFRHGAMHIVVMPERYRYIFRGSVFQIDVNES